MNILTLLFVVGIIVTPIAGQDPKCVCSTIEQTKKCCTDKPSLMVFEDFRDKSYYPKSYPKIPPRCSINSPKKYSGKLFADCCIKAGETAGLHCSPEKIKEYF